MSLVLENLRRDARMRFETDSEMSAGWVAIPLLSIGAAISYFIAYFFYFIPLVFTIQTNPAAQFAVIGGFFAILGIIILVLIASAIVFTVMTYKLVKRRNTHFNRQSFLYEDLTNLVKEVASKKGVDVSLPVNNLDRTLREARIEETEKSAALWAILSLITGLAVLYVYYFLMKDFFKHERREDAFIEDLNRALAATGVSVNLPRRAYPIPDRSFVLYFILSIITVGIFSVYWIYVLLTDPNSHFRQQALIEDTVVAQFAPILA